MSTNNDNGSTSSESIPEWLEDLIATIGDCLTAHSPMGPLGWMPMKKVK